MCSMTEPAGDWHSLQMTCYTKSLETLLHSESKRADVLADLGWRQRVALDEGLDRTVQWFREHRDDVRSSNY